MAEQVVFDRSLYLPEAVEAAAQAYADFAKIELAQEGDSIRAVIDETGDQDLQTVVHAFCNHVLHETVSRRRQGALDEGA